MKKKIYILIAGVKQTLFALALTLLVTASYSQTFNIVYTGSVQTLTVPTTGKYGIECWGANGGSVISVGGAGIGGYSMGELNLTAGTVLHIYVGGGGTPSSGLLTGNSGAGGWNGGGGGSKIGVSGGGGGGATDVRLGGVGPGNRIIVAGGGGGAAGYFSQTPNGLIADGGHGGGLAGANGNTITSGGAITIGGGGQGANGATPGAATGAPTANGTASGGGGGAYSVNGASAGGQGVGGGAGGAAGISGGGSTGCASGGGGGFAGGAGGVQNNNGAAAGGGGSGFVGGVNNGITVMSGQTGFVANPDNTGNGYTRVTFLCEVTAGVSQNPICIGDQVTLLTNATGNIQWSHGPTTPTAVVSPTVNTTYTLTGTGSTPQGCVNTIILTVTVNPLPNIAPETFPPMLCQGQTGTLSATGAATYTWNPGNGAGNVVTVNPASTTVYTVTGQNSFGCYNTSTVTMNVNTNQLTLSPDTIVCAGTPAYLRANGAVSYNWSVGAPFKNVTVYPSALTVYSVGATDMYGCALEGIVTVNVHPKPVVTVSSANTVVCKGEPVLLEAGGANSYLWSNGASGESITPATNVDLPLYFTVTGTDNNGCKSTASITVLVNACVSLNEEQVLAFRLLPNPATEQVTIESPADATWHINDLAGRTVLQGKLQQGSQSVNISTLASGVYLVRLQTSDSERTVRFIKN